jgi:dipeptidyl aminopeptidase/acylaminoacyl peptidase
MSPCDVPCLTLALLAERVSRLWRLDLSRYQAVGVERWMGLLHENKAGFREVNLINGADNLQGDLLLIHGTGDENVKFAFTLPFADSLIKQTSSST